jgi:hypothetical protein
MARIESSIFVPKSSTEIFAFLSKCESHRSFIPRMTELTQRSQGDFAQPGTTLSGMLNYFGLQIPVQYEITEVRPDHALTMNGIMGPVQFQDGYILHENGNETEIRFWLDLQPTGWTRVFSPFAGLIGKMHAWETLRNLRRELAKTKIAS